MDQSQRRPYQNDRANERIFVIQREKSQLDKRIEQKLEELQVRKESHHAFRFMCRMFDFFRWGGHDVDLRGYK